MSIDDASPTRLAPPVGAAPNVDLDARLRWEQREHLVEIDARLAESDERDHIRSLEHEALRRDLGVRIAYIGELEASLAATRAAVAEGEAELHRLRSEEEQRRAEIERLRAQVAAAAAEHADTHAQLALVAGALVAERSAASHRLVDGAILRLRRQPRLYAVLRWTCRRVARAR